uniref:uncharacterized protein LOC122601684 n=1 Tax=Erigeron canadensis TaxID=72917 RepID=UPI001CB99320|nr:uncharacterized protein LOC122601684 [Erigeron canadensis]
MNENGDQKKMKQGTLDSYFNVRNKRKTEDGLSSSLSVSSIDRENGLDQETQDTEMGTISSIFDLTPENEMQFWENDSSNFGQLMKIVLEYSTRKENRPPLLAPLLCLRYLLKQGLEIHGHEDEDEDEGLSIEENFVGLLKLLAKYDETIDEAAIDNASLIHKDMINSCAQETTKAIVKDIAGDFFAILVDEYFDVSEDREVALCLRYVDRGRCGKHSLSSSKIRGQGYNGLSGYIQGDIGGLRHLIMEETQLAYYSHCFVQLQTTLVAISRQKVDCSNMFYYGLNHLTSVLGVSWKDSEISQESQFEEVSQAFEDVPIEVARCLNQNIGSLERLRCTWWRPYHKLVSNVIEFYQVILDMLDMIQDNSSRAFDRFEFRVACDAVLSFDFVFMAHVMKTIFEVTDELNSVLQKKDEEFATAMSLVKSVTERLHEIRDGRWEAVLGSVISFCNENEIKVPNMEDMYAPLSRRRGEELKTTNLHHYQSI